MSEIKIKLQEDIKTAMKAKDSALLLILRGLSSEIKQVEVDTRVELSDEKVKEIFQKEVKKRRDTIKFAQDAGRTEIIEKNEEEIKIIQSYLGAQLTEEQLSSLIKDLIAQGNDSIGKIMAGLNKTHKSQFEGATASRIAAELMKG